jgi:hypothetical protein
MMRSVSHPAYGSRAANGLDFQSERNDPNQPVLNRFVDSSLYLTQRRNAETLEP